MRKSLKVLAAMFAALMCVGTACAQEENGFKKFEVRDDFKENGFEWFHNAEILAAGNKEKHNAIDRKSTRLNSSHTWKSRMPSSA